VLTVVVSIAFIVRKHVRHVNGMGPEVLKVRAGLF
jgi:hypothetical protein